MQLQQFTLWNVSDQQQQGAELDQLVRLDFSCIPSYLRDTLPNTDAPLRKIPFVARYAAELGGLYQRPVVRRFLTPLASDLPPEAWQKLGVLYDEARADAIMSTVETGLWLQQSFASIVLPYGQSVQIVPISPWQLLPTVSDAMRASDPSGWSSCDIQIPDRVDPQTGTITYSKITLTATEAWRYTGGKKTGIYSANGSHPFGRIPIVLGHRVVPEIGRPFAPINEPVHNLQIALCLLEAETELVIRHAAWPQKVIVNASVAQMTEQIALGPDKVIALLRSGDPTAPGPDLRVVQGTLPVTELTGWIEGRIKLYCAMLGIDPSAFLRVNTAVTVSARLFADATRRELRDRIRPVLERFERDLARLVAQVANLSGVVALPVEQLQVTIRWQDWSASIDPVADAQGLQQGVALGMRSVVDELAQRDGLSTSAALAKIEANLNESARLGLVTTTIKQPSTQDASLAIAADATAAVADTAMNGAQVTSLVEVIGAVAGKTMAPETGKILISIAFPLLDPAKVSSMVDAAARYESPVLAAQVAASVAGAAKASATSAVAAPVAEVAPVVEMLQKNTPEQGMEAERIEQLYEIVESVAERELAPAAAIELIALAFPELDTAAVRRMVDAAATTPVEEPSPAPAVIVETADAVVSVGVAPEAA